MPFIGKNPTAGFATIVKDDFTADGTTTVFTLSKIATVNDIAVYVGNVRQEPTDAYTVNGTTLTMSAAPATGVNFYVLHIAGTIESSVVPPDGSIGTAKLVNNAVTSAKLDTNIDIAGTLDVTGNTTLDSDVNIGTVGTIGTSTSYANQFEIKSTSSNLILNANNSNYAFDSTQFYPLTAGRSLGLGSNPFNNLYLSGGVYLGGTGSANYLDDYEEGTWTPVIVASAGNPSLSYGSQNGTYTKIGRYVYTTFFIQINGVSSQGSGNLRIGPLPFTLSTANSFSVENGAIFYDMSGIGQTINYATGRGIGTDQILLTNLNTSGAAQSLNTGSLNSNYVIGSYLYITDV